MTKSIADQLPTKLWKDSTIPVPEVKDVLVIVAEFLSNLKYKSSYTALIAEAKTKGIDIGKKDWAGEDHKSLLDLFVASHKLEQSSKSTEEEEEDDEDDSESESDDTDSSEDEEEKPAVKPEVNGAAKRKREATPDSSDEDSSEASSDSDSDSDAPPAKKTKAEPVKTAPVPKAQPAKKVVDDDSSSASDTSSDSDSDSSSESDSESDSSPPPKSKKAANGKIQPKAKDSSASSNGSSSSATLVETSPAETPKTKKTKTKTKAQQEEALAVETPIANGEMHPDRLARLPKSKDTLAEQQDGSAAKFAKKTNVPFSRISPHQKVDPRFSSNEYVSYDYADRAYQDLVVTKGKGFTKEKNKKKRGSYRGGMIDLTPKGIKFED